MSAIPNFCKTATPSSLRVCRYLLRRNLLDRETDTFLFDVNAQDFDFDDIADGIEFGDILYELIGHFGDMDQPVLMDVDIDEHAKVHDIPDGPIKDHARLKVFDVFGLLVKLDDLHVIAKVAARAFDFLDNVMKGLFTNPILGGESL